MLGSSLALLAAASVALAAPASDLDVALVKANFKNAGIVPDVFSEDDFNPQGLLGVTYSGSPITQGQSLEKNAVGEKPTWSFTPTEAAASKLGNATFTLALIDADVVGTDQRAAGGQTRHFLANGVGEGSESDGSFPLQESGDAITDYAGPGPAEGSGPHRYIWVLFKQGDDFSAPEGLNQPHTALSKFAINDYVESAHLGDLVAATYFQVEVGTATASFPATSAVDTAAVSSSLAATSTGSSSTGTATGAEATESTDGDNAAGSVHAGAAVGALAAAAALFLA